MLFFKNSRQEERSWVPVWQAGQGLSPAAVLGGGAGGLDFGGSLPPGLGVAASAKDFLGGSLLGGGFLCGLDDVEAATFTSTPVELIAGVCFFLAPPAFSLAAGLLGAGVSVL